MARSNYAFEGREIKETLEYSKTPNISEIPNIRIVRGLKHAKGLLPLSLSILETNESQQLVLKIKNISFKEI